MAGKALFAVGMGLLSSSCSVLAFVAPLQSRVSLGQLGVRRAANTAAASSIHQQRTTTRCCRMDIEELEPVNDLIKAQKIAVVDEANGVYKYKFQIEAQNSTTQRLHHRITRAVKEKADYPGHMKGQIPLQVQPEVNKYIVEQIINDSIWFALDTYGLSAVEEEGSEVEVYEDAKDLAAVFNPGKRFFFSCSIDAKPKPKEDEVVIDVGSDVQP